jgi:hypothetical protein
MNARVMIVVAVFAVCAACSETQDTTAVPPGTPTTDTPSVPDTTSPDTTSPDTHTEPTGPNKLWFSNTTGTDGQACVTTCAMTVTPGQALQLPVFYRDSLGNGIDKGTLIFKTTANPTMATLGEVISTNIQGLGVGILNTTAIAEGVVQITVEAINDAGAGLLTFNVQLGEITIDALSVTVNYTGATLATFEARLFLQNGATQKPTCADVDPDQINPTLPTIAGKGPLGNAETATWTNKELAGLLVAGTQLYTIQVVGPGTGDIKAEGCLDSIPVKSDGKRSVTIDVHDLPLKYQGNYGLTTYIDQSVLPISLGPVINVLADLFTSPGNLVLDLACANASGALSTICTALDTFGVKAAIAQNLDTQLIGLMNDTLPDGTVITGQTISSLLKDLRFGSTLTLNGEPVIPVTSADDIVNRSDFPEGTVSEVWETVSYFWKIGKGCDKPGAPENCGMETVKLSDIYGANPTATNMTAGTTPTHQLHIDKHTVGGLMYGPLVNFLIENKVMPLVFGAGVDSYENVVLSMLGGSNCLLGPKAQQADTCCSYFYNDVGPNIPDIPFVDKATVTKEACKAMVDVLANELEGLLKDVSGPMVVGTPVDGPCQALDNKPEGGDRIIDQLGSSDNHCDWDMSFDLDGESFVPESSTWHGTHK